MPFSGEIAHAQAAPGALSVPARQAQVPDRFFIAAFDVSGVSRLLPLEIEKAVYAFTGPARTSKDVEAARKAIQAAYAAHGYEAVVVDIPVQNAKLFQQGVVQLTVNEAPVGQIKVLDSRYHSTKRVLAEIPSLKTGAPLDLKALQSDLSQANRFPDRSIAPSFKAGKEPGTIDVDLKVQDSLPIHGSVDVNNDYSPSTTPLRVGGTARLTDLWGRGQSISATVLIAPANPSQSTVFSGSYLVPFIGSPWSMLLYGYYSDSNVSALGGTNVLGNGYQIGLRGIYKFAAMKTNQSLSFGLDFKDFKQKLTVGSALASSEPISYIPLVAEYTLSEQEERSQFNVTLGATAGLRLIKKTRLSTCLNSQNNPVTCVVDQFDDRALNSTENFVHVNLTGNAQYATKSDFVMKLGFAGQITNSHLVSNEQFSLGGFTSVRGYLLSEAVGDYGIDGQFDLQLPSLTPHLPHFVDELRFYAFVDGGYTLVYGAVPVGQEKRFSLLSSGGGLRFKIFEHLTGDIVAGVPLLDGPDTHKGDPRFTFDVKSEF